MVTTSLQSFEGSVGIGTDNPSKTLHVEGNVHITEDLNILGNILIQGETTTVETTNLNIQDPIIELGKNNSSGTDLGIIMTRPGSNVAVSFLEASDELVMAYTESHSGVSSVVPITSEDLKLKVYGDLTTTGNVTATYLHGDGSELTGIATTLQSVSDFGNTTTNTIEFKNATTGLSVDSNIVVGGNVTATSFIGDGSSLTGIDAGFDADVSNIAIGTSAGAAGANTVAIGNLAGQTAQGGDSVAIGRLAGQTTQRHENVAVGSKAGQTDQKTGTVAIGYQAGQDTQGDQGVAVGWLAGRFDQGFGGVAVGGDCARYTQGVRAIAMGYNAGFLNQGSNSVAMGFTAGYSGQGSNSIAIGYEAGKTSQHDNSIVLNASGSALDTTGASRTYIKPLQAGAVAGNMMAYDSTSGEVINYTGVSVNSSGNMNVSGTVDSGSAIASSIYSRGRLAWGNNTSFSLNKTLQGPNSVLHGALGNHWNTYSSRRLKENIEPILNSLDTLKKLRGVHFTWKNGQGDNLVPKDEDNYDTTEKIKPQKQIGFIADEVGEVLPSIVTVESDGHISGLDYSAITPILVNAVKELDDKVGRGEASSDDRLKDNETYVTNATQTIMKLRPQIYDKKESLTSNNYQHEAGLIAQDIWYDVPELRFAVKPGLLSQIPIDAPARSDDPREDTDYSMWGPNPASVDYNYLIPYVIKSIQELETELPKQKVRVNGITKSNVDTHRGLIVSAANDEFYISNVQQDKKCFGVISYSNTYSNNNEILIDTNGIGKVWVINSSNIESGDYITSSNINGYAMKQSDRSVWHSYTIAKSMTDCTFNPLLIPVKKIKQELKDVTYYVNTKLYEITKEQYDSLDELHRTYKEHMFYKKMNYSKVSGKGGAYDKLQYKKVDDEEKISIEHWESLDNDTQQLYSKYYSNLVTTHVSLEDYSTMDKTEKDKCVLTTKTIYSYKVREESKNPLPGYISEIRQEMVNVLDTDGQVQWEDHPTEKKKSYEVRFLDANGKITDESNAVYSAALINCKYY